MKAKIIGLTESTITFNEIEMSGGNKLIMHGKEEAFVILDTATKSNEIAVLEGCKLIKCVEINTDSENTQDEDATPKIDTPVDEAVDEEIEDSPSATKETEETEETKKRGRGRPKGAKNKKAIKRVNTKAKKPEETEKNTDNRAIVVNEIGKPIEASTITEEDKDTAEESEATKASIEAMEKLEEEEKEAKEKEKEPVNEETEDTNNQMGRKATVYTGEKALKVDMKNSMVPESEVAKESDPFIDKEESDDETNAFLEDIDEDIDKDFIEN